MQDVESVKYIIHATLEVDGVVEKHDVIGAIFGQTEGLLGNDMDLRDLQKSGRVGRIEVNVSSKEGKSHGEITIPSSLNKAETAILAAALETIERVGPCSARIKVERIEDIRSEKRKKVLERAKELLQEHFAEPSRTELSEELKEAVRVEEIRSYGPENLPAGPNIDDSDAIVIVEGRADVLNLLRCGIKNVIAMEGTKVPKTIVDLSQKKTVTAFVDGDRGGELILKELFQIAKIDYVARAPPGRGVEELSQKEVIKALKNKVPASEYIASKGWDRDDGELDRHMSELSGTLCARLLNSERKTVKEVAVRDLVDALRDCGNDVKGVVFDGIVTQRILDAAAEKGLEYIYGLKMGNVTRIPQGLKVITREKSTSPSRRHPPHQRSSS